MSTVGVNIYLYGCVSLMGPECAVCLYMCVSVCVIKSEYQQKKGGLSVLLSKVGGLTRWNCWKRGGDFFQGTQGEGGGQFLKKTLTKIGNI